MLGLCRDGKWQLMLFPWFLSFYRDLAVICLLTYSASLIMGQSNLRRLTLWSNFSTERTKAMKTLTAKMHAIFIVALWCLPPGRV